MISELEIEPGDRILALSIPDAQTIRTISASLRRGGFVCLGGREEVYAARREMRDLPNVLFHPGPPEEIPFDDEYFTLVFDPACSWSDPARVVREIARVLAGGGRAALAIGEPALLVAAGLEPRESAGGELRLFRRPEGMRPPPPYRFPVLR